MSDSGQAVPVPGSCAAASPCSRRGGTGGCHSRDGKVTEGRSCRGSFEARRVTSRSRLVFSGRGGTATAPTVPGGRGDDGQDKGNDRTRHLPTGSLLPSPYPAAGEGNVARGNRCQPSEPVRGAPRLRGAEGFGDRTLVPTVRPGRAAGSAMTPPAPRSPHQVVPELLAAHIVHGLTAQRRRHGVSAAVR